MRSSDISHQTHVPKEGNCLEGLPKALRGKKAENSETEARIFLVCSREIPLPRKCGLNGLWVQTKAVPQKLVLFREVVSLQRSTFTAQNGESLLVVR